MEMDFIQCKSHYIIDRLVATTKKIERPIIISGFWRSGTTWLQGLVSDAVKAKTIFEPFEPSSFMPLYIGKSALYGGYIPFSTSEFSSEDWRFLDLAFKGVSPSRSGFNYLCRKSVLEAFRNKVVIKFVRAQVVMPDLIRRYNPQVTIHVSRHPLAVIQSMMKANWVWSFEQIDFENFYQHLDLEKHPYADEISYLMSSNNAPSYKKIAALWAMTEKVMYETAGVVTCKYENLLSDTENCFAELLEESNLVQLNQVDFLKDSPVTIQSRVGATSDERLNSWKQFFQTEQRLSIISILEKIWPDVHKYWDLGS